MPQSNLLEKKPDWIVVPSRKVLERSSPSSKYGAAHEAAKYCGLDRLDFPREDFTWKHGWRPDYVVTTDPVYTAQNSLDQADTPVYVARRIEADYLRDCGFTRARAIGMPICYAQKPQVQRRPNSLLVMPVHSLSTTTHVWPFMQYADTIAALKDDFDEIVVCLHPSCIEHGYWIEEFESHGIAWLSGADTSDVNSLSRVRHLCSQFEFMTTNGLNSSIVYAAADGARVSIFGPYCKIETCDVEHVPFYSQNPGLAEKILPLLGEEPVREHLPQFFCHPREATQSIDWGKQQLGDDCMPTASELKSLLFEQREPENEDARVASQQSKDRRDKRVSRNSGLAASQHEKLMSMGEDEIGSVTVDGETLHVADSNRFVDEFERTFDKHLFEFPCIYADPLIFDGCAGHGLAVRYWLSKLVDAQVIACEENPRLYESLKKNTTQYSSPQLTLKTGDAQSQFDLIEGREVEFFRLDLAGDNTDALQQLTPHLTGIKRLCLNYQSLLHQSQSLARVLQTLEGNGFRYHLIHDRRNVSRRPFMRVRVDGDIDQRLTVWAYQGDRFPRTHESKA